MNNPRLILVLGDQLSLLNPALAAARPGTDVILMAEVAEEAGYVRHNRHKIALVFAAMRHFRDQLRERGHTVRYGEYREGIESLEQAVRAELGSGSYAGVSVCEPGEYRLLEAMQQWSSVFDNEVEILADTRSSVLIVERDNRLLQAPSLKHSLSALNCPLLVVR